MRLSSGRLTHHFAACRHMSSSPASRKDSMRSQPVEIFTRYPVNEMAQTITGGPKLCANGKRVSHLMQ